MAKVQTMIACFCIYFVLIWYLPEVVERLDKIIQLMETLNASNVSLGISPTH